MTKSHLGARMFGVRASGSHFLNGMGSVPSGTYHVLCRPSQRAPSRLASSFSVNGPADRLAMCPLPEPHPELTQPGSLEQVPMEVTGVFVLSSSNYAEFPDRTRPVDRGA